MMSPPGEFLAVMVRGESPALVVHRGFQVAVRVVLPPFPFDDETTFAENSRNAAIVFDTPDGGPPDGLHIEDAKRVDGQWRVAGEAGMPLVATGMGETMQAARAAAYDVVDDVIAPNLYYRDDIGERRIDGDGDRLLAWGYLGGSRGGFSRDPTTRGS